MPVPGLVGWRVRLERGDLAQDLRREFGLEAVGTHGVGGRGLKIEGSKGVLHGLQDSI